MKTSVSSSWMSFWKTMLVMSTVPRSTFLTRLATSPTSPHIARLWWMSARVSSSGLVEAALAASGNHSLLSFAHCAARTSSRFIWILIPTCGSAIVSPRCDHLQELCLSSPGMISEYTTHCRRGGNDSWHLHAAHRHAHVFAFEDNRYTSWVKVCLDLVCYMSCEILLHPQALSHVLHKTSELR